ncbi:nuclear pore component-domain-containing protein [Abortiporus biennis]|nr:nuclear pore component-domain-containing protein [Abortiporus biennis]
MDAEEDWNAFLKDHPVLSLPKSVAGPAGKGEVALELSMNTLPNFTSDLDPVDDGPTPSGRRQVMIIRESDLIVASGSEVRIAPLGDSKLSKSGGKAYKILNTPNVSFEIHTMALNPNAKLLAIAGAFQVAVIVLPRSGFTKLVPTAVECKSIQIGQYYHAAQSSPPIAKIEWHPWGQGGTTLLVMTVDGKLREYDIALDTEEPQQVLSFVPEKKSKSFVAEDPTEREVVSFTLGKGNADWGPLSVYALMKSGDIYAISPYMPQNASVPSSYIHALDCFVHAKQEYLSQSHLEGGTSSSLNTLYDYQHRYVSALLKQLPPGTAFPAAPRAINMHPPTTIKSKPIRQGPFLLQPSPRELDGSEGVDATDITYLTFGTNDDEESDGETERLGVVLITSKDGKVDICLDVEKVEAKWEHRGHVNNDLPMLAVYETIDLGLVFNLSRSSAKELLQGNHPVFLRDPIQDETVYVYHAFGVHALLLGPLLRNLAAALRDDNSNDGTEDGLVTALGNSGSVVVQPLLTTFSVERKCSNPVIGVAVPNDVYLTYSIFILTSAMRVTTFPLTLTSDSIYPSPEEPKNDKTVLAESQKMIKDTPDTPRAYVSLLVEPYSPPASLSRPSGLPFNPKLSLPPGHDPKAEFQLTPDTLRYLASLYEKFMQQVREVQLAYRAAMLRVSLQEQEFARQQRKCQEMMELIGKLQKERQDKTREKIQNVKESQKELLSREDKILKGLMKSASPDLSEHESKWFEELRRMKEEVTGVARYDQDSFTTRTGLLRKELDRLLPNLKELNEKEKRLKKRLSEGTQTIGPSQAFEFGKRSRAEREKISKVEAEIVKLAEKLDITLERPPALSAEQDDEI